MQLGPLGLLMVLQYVYKQINTVQPRYNALDTKIASLYLILVTSIQTDIGEKKAKANEMQARCQHNISYGFLLC